MVSAGGGLRAARRGLGSLRLGRHEVAGSLGDLGTFIPLFVSMVVVNGLSASSVLFFAGLFNVITGFTFGIPMPVQPMKAIATVAITEKLAPSQVYAAGIIVSAVVFLVGITGLSERLNRWIPTSVVRGLQLGLGLKLTVLGLSMARESGTFWGVNGVIMALAAALLGLLLFRNRRVPSAPLIFGLGLAASAFAAPHVWRSLHFSLSLPALTLPGAGDFAVGAVKGALPQLPLTLLNSVVAVCALSWALFPTRGASTRKVAVSVGLMNLIGCWFGAMPMCHGAGGLAGQHFFGARTGRSVVFLGLVKMALGLLAGGATLAVLMVYPHSVLGVLLLFAALELAAAALDVKGKQEGLVLLVTAGAILGLDSTFWGFLVGLGVAYLLMVAAHHSSPSRPLEP